MAEMDDLIARAKKMKRLSKRRIAVNVLIWKIVVRLCRPVDEKSVRAKSPGKDEREGPVFSNEVVTLLSH